MPVKDFAKPGHVVPVPGATRGPSTFDNGSLKGELLGHGELAFGFTGGAEDHANRKTGLSGQGREEIDLVWTGYVGDEQYATHRRPLYTTRSG